MLPPKIIRWKELNITSPGIHAVPDHGDFTIDESDFATLEAAGNPLVEFHGITGVLGRPAYLLKRIVAP